MNLNELQQQRINLWLEQAENTNMNVKDVVVLDEMLTNIVENLNYNQNLSYFPRLLNNELV